MSNLPHNILHRNTHELTHPERRRHLHHWLAVAAGLGLSAAAPAWAKDPALPGKGVRVLPLKSNLIEEAFQTLLVMRALEQLGYNVAPFQEVEYPLAHLAVANGDATFIANHWNPHHAEFYKSAGGDATLSRKGVFAAGAVQGYLMDKRTAQKYGITSLGQLQDPELAKLFDTDGDGKANLVGPNAGWGAEAVVFHHLKTFDLEKTVSYTQGSYPALISETLARFKEGKPVVYYGWIPYWLSNVLRPGQEVIWLEVPYSSMPGVQAGTNTKLANGKDYGFPLNNQYIVGNKKFVADNPAAAKLFEIMRLPIADITAQNALIHQGQGTPAHIQRHANAWIRAHQSLFDGWLNQARAAAK
ncbi:MAG: glycine betaine/L-proline ABC transporter substrate-binding protein ProX [Comamonas sp.]|nr:glycine betaine/L-proline ABC transporter substrate-binding protein ProX [Comamonas sp.]